MRKYQNLIAFTILLISLILYIFKVLTPYLPLALIILSALLFAKATIGNIFFVKGLRYLREEKKDIGKANLYFERALKAGLPPNYALVAASALLQNGEEEKAKNAIVPLTKDSSKKVSEEAKVIMSLYHWQKGDIKSAIALAEEAKENGYGKVSVYVNLATYYLKGKDMGKFRMIIEETIDKNIDSPALMDFKGLYYMLRGSWKKALKTLSSFLELSTPSSIDLYVHLALVYLHYGEVKRAIETLDKSLSSTYPYTLFYEKEDVERIKDALSSPHTSKNAALAINNSTLSLISGEIPVWQSDENGLYSDRLSGFEEMEEDEKEEETYTEGDINTSLTDEDEEWLRKHTDDGT